MENNSERSERIIRIPSISSKKQHAAFSNGINYKRKKTRWRALNLFWILTMNASYFITSQFYMKIHLQILGGQHYKYPFLNNDCTMCILDVAVHREKPLFAFLLAYKLMKTATFAKQLNFSQFQFHISLEH